eukprot:scaffold150074_cov18-Tisochrysis_lutea.AAC.1
MSPVNILLRRKDRASVRAGHTKCVFHWKSGPKWLLKSVCLVRAAYFPNPACTFIVLGHFPSLRTQFTSICAVFFFSFRSLKKCNASQAALYIWLAAV